MLYAVLFVLQPRFICPIMLGLLIIEVIFTLPEYSKEKKGGPEDINWQLEIKIEPSFVHSFKNFKAY